MTTRNGVLSNAKISSLIIGSLEMLDMKNAVRSMFKLLHGGKRKN